MLPLALPGVEGLTRRSDLLAQLGHLSVAPLVGDQTADYLDSLVHCATMSLNHWFLLVSHGVAFSLPYQTGSPLATLLAHTVKFVLAAFEPCLNFIIGLGSAPTRHCPIMKFTDHNRSSCSSVA